MNFVSKPMLGLETKVQNTLILDTSWIFCFNIIFKEFSSTMLNPNIARNLVVVSAAAITCLGMSACSGQEAAAPVAPATALATPETNTTDTQPSVETTYYPNGTRLTTTYIPSRHTTMTLSFCDGHDLLDVVLEDYISSGAAGGSTARTQNHPACADGRLDPKDFTK